ncbi:MAG TPA: hypothetical protein VFW74_09525, partial [Acidimicrobiia bacterium]|nr:hypothetical protein [Acidimicrobiia bacterium]
MTVLQPAARPRHAPSADADTLKRRVHARLVGAGVAFDDDASHDLRARVADLLREEAPLLRPALHDVLLDELVREVTGLGPLEPLLDDPSITEIMLNGAGRAFVERDGRLEPVALGLDAATIVRL